MNDSDMADNVEAATPDELDEGEGANAAHAADRPATPDEEAEAEAVSGEVDLESVIEHEREMADLGVNAKGEGRIE